MGARHPPYLMATAERILTDEMVAAIQALLPRYPTRQAVTLPALHIVNNQLRHVPLAAVVEIAELLELAPAQVQDTLSFYGFFKQDAPHGRTRGWICRSLSCAARQRVVD
ncbi:MAG: NAD(P)H-dependent oxidoreductase subunit E [Pirellulales bacterium]